MRRVLVVLAAAALFGCDNFDRLGKDYCARNPASCDGAMDAGLGPDGGVPLDSGCAFYSLRTGALPTDLVFVNVGDAGIEYLPTGLAIHLPQGKNFDAWNDNNDAPRLELAMDLPRTTNVTVTVRYEGVLTKNEQFVTAYAREGAHYLEAAAGCTTSMNGPFQVMLVDYTFQGANSPSYWAVQDVAANSGSLSAGSLSFSRQYVSATDVAITGRFTTSDNVQVSTSDHSTPGPGAFRVGAQVGTSGSTGPQSIPGLDIVLTSLEICVQ